MRSGNVRNKEMAEEEKRFWEIRKGRKRNQED